MNINSIWDEGKYFDMWSVVHTLSGVVLAGFLFNFKVSMLWSVLIASGAFVAWEIIEVVTGIDEHWPNRIMDVATDFLGFFVTYLFYFVFDKPYSWQTLSVITAVFAALEIWGFISYRKRKNKQSI